MKADDFLTCWFYLKHVLYVMIFKAFCFRTKQLETLQSHLCCIKCFVLGNPPFIKHDVTDQDYCS